MIDSITIVHSRLVCTGKSHCPYIYEYTRLDLAMLSAGDGKFYKDKVPRLPSCAVLCCAVLCCAVLCCAVLCCAVLCCAVLCCAVLCCAVLCCAVLCCAVLCCAEPEKKKNGKGASRRKDISRLRIHSATVDGRRPPGGQRGGAGCECADGSAAARSHCVCFGPPALSVPAHADRLTPTPCFTCFHHAHADSTSLRFALCLWCARMFARLGNAWQHRALGWPQTAWVASARR